MITPRGWQMSVALTNCGQFGWVTDRRGYRYDRIDPLTGRPWPAMPPIFEELAVEAAEAAGFTGFHPDACLVNRYALGRPLSLHQRNERDWISQHSHGAMKSPLFSDSSARIGVPRSRK